MTDPDPLDRRLRQLMGEVAASAPEPPDLPGAMSPERGTDEMSGARSGRSFSPKPVLAAAALVLLLGLGALALNSREPHVDVATADPDPSPTAEPVSSPVPDRDDTSQPTQETQETQEAQETQQDPVAGVDSSCQGESSATALCEAEHDKSPPGQTLLLPAQDWKVELLYSDVLVSRMRGPSNFTLAATDLGIFGPVVEAHYVADVDYRDVGNRGTAYYDTQTAAGSPVRVRTENAPHSIEAVISVESGSISVTSLDIAESDLLTIIDGLRVEDGLVKGEALEPSTGLSWREPLTTYPASTRLEFVNDDEQRLWLRTYPLTHWQLPFFMRLSHIDTEQVEIAGRPGWVYRVEETGEAGAVYRDGKLFYLLDPILGAGVETLMPILDALTEVSMSTIASELGLVARSEVIEPWIQAAPLPPGTDLAWFLEGPPTKPDQEAYPAHQLLACALAVEWIESGDTAVLDEIADSESWPTAAIIEERRFSLPIVDSVEAARTLGDRSARESSELASECAFLRAIQSYEEPN